MVDEGSAAELHELREAERALAETNERYRSLFDYHPDPVFALDLEGRFVSTNRSSSRVSGYSADELLTMSFIDLLEPQDIERLGEVFVAVLERRPQHVNVTIRRPDGVPVDLSVNGLPVIVGDEVVGVYGIAEDVTERNQLVRELECARREAEQASEAKSLFLANMSHEIRTPLTSVLAAGELLAEMDLTAPQRRLTDIMRRAGGRLLRLVDDILDLSRIEAGMTTLAPEAFAVADLLDDVVTPVRAAAAAKGLSFEVSTAGDLPDEVVGDQLRIGQIMTNLLGNAVKFTESGFVRLTVGHEPAAGVQVLALTVEDSGIGMTPEQVGRVFEAFSQADTSITRNYGGTGLGLAITRQLVDLMDGSIDAVSVPGAGTTFSVRIPT